MSSVWLVVSMRGWAAPDIKLFIEWPQWQVQLRFIPQSTIAALSKYKLIVVELTAQVVL